MNNNAGTINLTPNSSYSCKYYDIPPNQTDLLGELSWNNTTKKLTVRGAIYIDGSAVVSNNSVNEYDGLATLYLSGTFRIDGNAQLCGGVASNNCDFTAWDPNTDNLGIIANGNDGSGNSIVMANQSRLQGSLYATYAVDLGSFAVYDGPMVAGTFKLANNIADARIPDDHLGAGRLAGQPDRVRRAAAAAELLRVATGAAQARAGPCRLEPR